MFEDIAVVFSARSVRHTEHEISSQNIIDVVRAFFSFNLILSYTSSYHFSSYLEHFPNIVGALKYSSSFSMQKKMSVVQSIKIG